MIEYLDFIKNKNIIMKSCGFDIDVSELNNMMFDFQKDIVRWALKKRKMCYFCRLWNGKDIDAA